MDEFFGNLYHLNAEEEPEHEDYPTEADFPDFKKKFGPRGVMHTFADGRVEDTGPLTKKRMETIDVECADKAIDFIKRTIAAGQPFYVWVNTTHMHFRTHAAPHERGLSGRWMSEYCDVMVSHSKLVGRLLDALDEMGLTDNTVVMYSTDNGPHANTWPDAGTTPFRGEKNTNWEGAYRVPCLVRWPGVFPAGKVLNGIVSHADWCVWAWRRRRRRRERVWERESSGGGITHFPPPHFFFLPPLSPLSGL
jgi:arylsulfatase